MNKLNSLVSLVEECKFNIEGREQTVAGLPGRCSHTGFNVSSYKVNYGN